MERDIAKASKRKELVEESVRAGGDSKPREVLGARESQQRRRERSSCREIFP